LLSAPQKTSSGGRKNKTQAVLFAIFET